MIQESPYFMLRLNQRRRTGLYNEVQRSKQRISSFCYLALPVRTSLSRKVEEPLDESWIDQLEQTPVASCHDVCHQVAALISLFDTHSQSCVYTLFIQYRYKIVQVTSTRIYTNIYTYIYMLYIYSLGLSYYL